VCGSPYDIDMPYDSQERDISLMNFGYTNFDNFFTSLLTVYHLTRTTGWSSITYLFWRNFNSYFTGFYILSLMIILAYVLINMLLGNLHQSFKAEMEKRLTRKCDFDLDEEDLKEVGEDKQKELDLIDSE
jgi:hypothetical protein